MKRLSIILSILYLCSTYALCKDLISRDIMLQNGDIVPLSHIFTEQETPITFSRTDTKAPGDWSFYILNENTKDFELKITKSVGAGSKTFTLNPRDFNWLYATRFKGENGYDLFKGKIEFVSYYEEVDTFSIYFRLAPSIPVLKDMSMQYEYDWGYDCFSEDSKIQFSVAVHDAATVSVLVSDPYYYCYDDSFFAIYEVQLPVENDSIYKYETLTDWGTIYKIYARNFFGYSYCDSIIFTTDLITDPQITERLNQLKNEETDIDVIPTDISDIQIVAKNQVFIPSDYAYICVIDIVGRKYSLPCENSIIDLSPLPNGMYIIIYKNANNTLSNFKLLKS